MKQPIYFKQLELGPMQNYVYLLGDPTTHEAAVVDAAWDVDALVRTAEADGYRITTDLVTHFHPDHLGGDLMGHQIRGAAELVAKVLVEVKRIREERAERSDFSDFHRRYYDHLNRMGLSADEVVDIAKALTA